MERYLTFAEKAVARINANVLRQRREEAAEAAARGEPLCRCGLMTEQSAKDSGHECPGPSPKAG
jgi:hypothetical protein